MPCFRHALTASFALIICSIFHVVSQRIVLHRRRGSHDALPVSQGEGRAGTSMSCNYIMPADIYLSAPSRCSTLCFLPSSRLFTFQVSQLQTYDINHGIFSIFENIASPFCAPSAACIPPTVFHSLSSAPKPRITPGRNLPSSSIRKSRECWGEEVQPIRPRRKSVRGYRCSMPSSSRP
jgi:hypothetical protein